MSGWRRGQGCPRYAAFEAVRGPESIFDACRNIVLPLHYFTTTLVDETGAASEDLGALCERDRACPRFTRMELHNHLSMVYQFNTADDALGRQILEFIRRGR
jgi:hypothetical protein